MSKAQKHRSTAHLRRDFKKRLICVSFVFALYGIAIIVKLFYLQIHQHKDFLVRSEKQYTRTVKIFYGRGKIFDRNGNELASNLEVESVYVNPEDIRDKRYTARMLSGILSLKMEGVLKKVKASKHFVWIKRKCLPRQIKRIKLLSLPGVGFVREQKRFYPKRELGAGVIGFVGLDNQGLAGIEHYHDTLLHRDTSLKIMEKDARGRFIRTAGSKNRPPSQSADIWLTLDEVIQFSAEYELNRQVKKYRAKGGMVIVMAPDTGEIYAMASVPRYNPNNYNAYPARYWANPNVSNYYEPGSIFKPIVAAAAMNQGVSHPDDIFFCQNGRYKIGSTLIKEASGHQFGWLSLSRIIQKSSNIGAIKIAEKLGAKKLYASIRRFGFGEKMGIDLPGESRGRLTELKDWSKLSGPSISFGHEIGVTPIQMIAAISAIANGGNIMHPRVTRKMVFKDGVEKNFEPVIINRALSPKTSRQMSEILKAVVRKGTGRNAATSGYEVAGKTGTAQKFDLETQSYSKTAYLSSFIGFIPADAPKLAILVMIDEPKDIYWGGEVAAPVFRKIAKRSLRYLNVPSKQESVYILDRA